MMNLIEKFSVDKGSQQTPHNIRYFLQNIIFEKYIEYVAIDSNQFALINHL